MTEKIANKPAATTQPSDKSADVETKGATPVGTEPPVVNQMGIAVQVFLDMTNPKFTAILQEVSESEDGERAAQQFLKQFRSIEVNTDGGAPVVYNMANPMAKGDEKNPAFGPFREAILQLAVASEAIGGRPINVLGNSKQIKSMVDNYANRVLNDVVNIFQHGQDQVVVSLEAEGGNTEFKFSDFIRVGQYVAKSEEFAVNTHTVVVTFHINALSLYLSDQPYSFISGVFNRLLAILTKKAPTLSMELGVLLAPYQLEDPDVLNLIAELVSNMGFEAWGHKQLDKVMEEGSFTEESSILLQRVVSDEMPEEEVEEDAEEAEDEDEDADEEGDDEDADEEDDEGEDE